MTQLMKKLMSSAGLLSLAVVGGLTMTSFGATSARADATDELLELLRRKGAINKKEYAVIKSRHAAEKTASRGPMIRGEAGGPAPRYVTAVDKGVGIKIPGSVIFTKDGSTSIGDVNVVLSGNLNAFYVQQLSNGVRGQSTGINGGIADPSKNSSAVRGSLLPAAVILDISTRQERYDISGTVGIFTGINNVNQGTFQNGDGPGVSASTGSPGVVVKLAYLKVGTNGFGTFEAGRDFGLFGQDILTFDQNELAVGYPNANLQPTNFSLGQFGAGYIFSDFVPQFRYTTETFNGFTATFAVETPYDSVPTAIGAIGGTAPGQGFHDVPQFDGRIKYVGALMPNVMLTAWAGGLGQQLEGLNRTDGAIFAGANPKLRSVTAYAGEAGAKLDIGAAEIIGYGYFGHGVGTTALLFGGIDNQGTARDSYGFTAQASYTFFERLTIAGGVGISYLQHTAFDTSRAELAATCPSSVFGAKSGACNVKVNEIATATVRYKVTKWLNLVGQYVHGRSKALDGTTIDSDAGIAGAQIFF